MHYIFVPVSYCFDWFVPVLSYYPLTVPQYFEDVGHVSSAIKFLCRTDL